MSRSEQIVAISGAIIGALAALGAIVLIILMAGLSSGVVTIN